MVELCNTGTGEEEEEEGDGRIETDLEEMEEVEAKEFPVTTREEDDDDGLIDGEEEEEDVKEVGVED